MSLYQDTLLKIYPDVLNLILKTDDKDEIFDIIEITKESVGGSSDYKFSDEIDVLGGMLLDAEDNNDEQLKKQIMNKLKDYIKENFYNELFSKIENQKQLVMVLRLIQSINPNFDVLSIVNKLRTIKFGEKKYKSPQKYIPRLTIYDENLKPTGIVPPFQISKERMEKYYKEQDRQYEKEEYKIDTINTDYNKDIKFMKLEIPKNPDIIKNTKFTSFLCDLETFNWERGITTKERINYFTFGDYSIYITYLCKKYGNDITLFGRTFYDKSHDTSQIVTNNAIVNQSFSFYDDSRKKFVHYPILVINSPRESINFYYVNQLFEFKTRYRLTELLIKYDSVSHFTALFIDTESKTVDYYDPNGRTGDKKVQSYIYRVLKILFPEYTISKVWRLQGLQKTEIYERQSGITDEGFCVIWGNLMLHLKLLNIDMSFQDLEFNILKECFDKKLSIYEVMLNYAYSMSRLIPKDLITYNLLENYYNI